MRTLILPFLFLLTFIFSCRENTNDEILEKTVNSVDVYVAGKENNIACYWKNNVKINLANGTGITARKIIVENNDVYIFGEKYNSYYDIEYYLWKNNVKYNLKTYLGIPSASISYFDDFTVKNNVVLFSGYVDGTGIGTNSNYDMCYWKNGIKTILQSNQNHVYKTSIDFYNNNVYLSAASHSYYINNVFHSINGEWMCNFTKNNNGVYHIYIDNNNSNLNFYNTTNNTLESTVSFNQSNFNEATIITDPITNNLYTFSSFFDNFYIKNNLPVNFVNNIAYKRIIDMKVLNDITYMIRITETTSSNNEYKVLINNVETQYINATNGVLTSIFVVQN